MVGAPIRVTKIIRTGRRNRILTKVIVALQTTNTKDHGNSGNITGEQFSSPDPVNGSALLSAEFTGVEDAYTSYVAYAKDIGFAVRKGDSVKDEEENIVRKFFYCNRQGLWEKKHYERVDRKRPHKLETRMNCNSKLVVFLDKSCGKWRTKALVEEHNHDLASPAFTKGPSNSYCIPKPPAMSHPINSTATAKEIASMEHIRALICAARSARQRAGSSVHANPWSFNQNDVLRQLTLADHHDHGIEFFPDRDWSHVALYKSRQTSFRQVCTSLHEPPPIYHMQTYESATRGTVHRFLVAVPTASEYSSCSATGRYSNDEHLAREDAATALLRKLLELHEMVVDDFNQDLLEEEKPVHYETRNALERLRARYRNMASSFRNYRLLNHPNYLSSSSESASD